MRCTVIARCVILLDALRHVAYILEFYIVNDIIMICLTVNGSVDKPKLRNPFRRHEIAPASSLPVFLLIYLCKLDKTYRVSEARQSGYALEHHMKKCHLPNL